MKKFFCLLAAAASLILLVGCGQKNVRSAFETDNEIATYERIDPAKTQLVVSCTGNIAVEGLCQAFEAQNPDVQVLYTDVTGGNGDYAPLVDWIHGGYAADIVISAAAFLDDEMTTAYFENLSSDSLTQSYEAAALQRAATGGEIYWLPGPSDISAMMYNKTLFAQYGWQVPRTFNEFVALCDRIRQDTNGEVEPWNPNAKYSDELTTALESFTYEQLFGGVDNRTWYHNLTAGKAVLTGHMEPYATVLQTLIDHGILRPEHFTYSATTRGKEFAAGKIAMINGSIYNADNDQFDFGYMPFPTTQGELGYLCNRYSCYVGLTAKERTAKQADAAHRFLAYFSSPEGQTAYIGNSIKVSSVKDVPLSWTDDLASLQLAIDAGHLFALLDFGDTQSGGSRVYLHQMAMDMVMDGVSGETCLAAMDEKLTAPAQTAPPETPETIAAVERDMTMLETSFCMADAYREAAAADIGLIAHNEVFRGNVMRLFAGPVTEKMVTVFKPRSFANDAALVKVSMTGRQLVDALNHPVGNDEVADCIYVYSGLQCEVAPWNEPGGRYLSVKLADGTPLDMDALYTVAAWDGTIAPEYITRTLETYPGTWEALMTDSFRADGVIIPAADGRIKLIWK